MSKRQGDPVAVAHRLAAASRVLVTTHASPDGDAIGCELALAEMLDTLGVIPTVANRDPYPANLAFLPGVGRIVAAGTLPENLTAAFDLLALLDCAGLDRPRIDGLATLPVVHVDHHVAGSDFAAVRLVDESAAATAELVLEVIDAAGVALTPSMATNLHTALATDTGDFRYANASPRAFRTAARLVEAGAVPAVISRELWERVPARVVRITAAVLSTLELLHGGRTALMQCDRAMLVAAGAEPADTEDLVNYARSVDGVEVAVLLKDFVPGAVRVSLRAKGRVDVQAIASTLGGGGHREAAGCTLAMSLAEARTTVAAAVAGALESV